MHRAELQKVLWSFVMYSIPLRGRSEHVGLFWATANLAFLGVPSLGEIATSLLPASFICPLILIPRPHQHVLEQVADTFR